MKSSEYHDLCWARLTGGGPTWVEFLQQLNKLNAEMKFREMEKLTKTLPASSVAPCALLVQHLLRKLRAALRTACPLFPSGEVPLILDKLSSIVKPTSFVDQIVRLSETHKTSSKQIIGEQVKLLFTHFNLSTFSFIFSIIRQLYFYTSPHLKTIENALGFIVAILDKESCRCTKGNTNAHFIVTQIEKLISRDPRIKQVVCYITCIWLWAYPARTALTWFGLVGGSDAQLLSSVHWRLAPGSSVASSVEAGGAAAAGRMKSKVRSARRAEGQTRRSVATTDMPNCF
jgi:hypothetical protein